MDCEFDDKKIENTINEKLKYLKFKGLQNYNTKPFKKGGKFIPSFRPKNTLY